MVICENINYTQLVKMSKNTTRSAFPVNNTANHLHSFLTNTNHQFYHLYITIFLIGIIYSFLSGYKIRLQNTNMVNYLARFNINETYLKTYIQKRHYNIYQLSLISVTLSLNFYVQGSCRCT